MKPVSSRAPVALLTLGSLEIQAPAGRRALQVLRQPKRSALLVFLTLQPPGAFVSRDRLMAIFWPEKGPEKARANLRQALRFLGRELPDGVVHAQGRDSVGVAPGQVSCDVHRFRSLVSDGAHGQALDLYRGPFLDGFYFRNAGQAFQDWLEATRQEFRYLAAEASWSIACCSETAGDPVRAAYWGKKAVGLAPRSEARMRELMLLLERVGDRAGALRVYGGLEEWLSQDLGTAPSEDTQVVARRLRQASATSGSGPVPGDRRSGLARRADEDRRQAEGDWPDEERRVAARRVAPRDRRSGKERRRSW